MGARQRVATYQDVLDAPEHLVAELIDSVLYTRARPRERHGRFATRLGGVLFGELEDGLGRQGGWVFIDEPELHLGPDVLVPDLAAWRTDRYPDDDPDAAAISVPPDWICEVLSPSTATIDRAKKLPVYARAGVAWAWLADPGAHTLEIYRRSDPLWTLVAMHVDVDSAHAEPFSSFELPLRKLWPPS